MFLKPSVYFLQEHSSMCPPPYNLHSVYNINFFFRFCECLIGYLLYKYNKLNAILLKGTQTSPSAGEPHVLNNPSLPHADDLKIKTWIELSVPSFLTQPLHLPSTQQLLLSLKLVLKSLKCQ